jgi:uncharacterized membrane protein
MSAMFAQVGSTAYNVMLLLHILTALVAFAPAFTHPFLAGQMKDSPDSRRTMLGFMAGNGRRIYAPALILTGLLGFGLSGMSDGIYALSQTWLLAAIVIWIGMNGVLHAVMLPAEKALAAGDDSAESRMGIGGAILTVGLVVMIYLMVFKPGL